MSIHVICPGCMTQFEVSDRFAGKKGPCPKCGHIIEIPKANVTIVSPDEMVVDGKKVHNPDHVRPIEQKSYSFTGHALLVNLGVFAAVLAVALFFHFVHMPYLAVPVGILLGLAVAFPLMKYGYMTFRDPDDLEIFLGGELGAKLFACHILGLLNHPQVEDFGLNHQVVLVADFLLDVGNLLAGEAGNDAVNKRGAYVAIFCKPLFEALVVGTKVIFP